LGGVGGRTSVSPGRPIQKRSGSLQKNNSYFSEKAREGSTQKKKKKPIKGGRNPGEILEEKRQAKIVREKRNLKVKKGLPGGSQDKAMTQRSKKKGKVKQKKILRKVLREKGLNEGKPRKDHSIAPGT